MLSTLPSDPGLSWLPVVGSRARSPGAAAAVSVSYLYRGKACPLKRSWTSGVTSVTRAENPRVAPRSHDVDSLVREDGVRTASVTDGHSPGVVTDTPVARDPGKTVEIRDISSMQDGFVVEPLLDERSIMNDPGVVPGVEQDLGISRLRRVRA